MLNGKKRDLEHYLQFGPTISSGNSIQQQEQINSILQNGMQDCFTALCGTIHTKSLVKDQNKNPGERKI